MKLSLLYVLVLFSVTLSLAQIPYLVLTEPWSESFGNHRVVLEGNRSAPAASPDLLWWWHNRDSQVKRFLIVHTVLLFTSIRAVQYKIV
ncbi:hypothetical protein SAMN06265379_102182 [Saccharicrinis carchari]|uniref:Uncharacterized protein n=1 Tax=Saccharicrinis carchari TaxID=1168039 RepID=A0A521BXK1_SACCC|nr:hypothetical protein [Saccharicrinis carchari]SMO51908.1 hypothetical protein SAMN06265379_102182 [Saccharicrinis carchari]